MFPPKTCIALTPVKTIGFPSSRIWPNGVTVYDRADSDDDVKGKQSSGITIIDENSCTLPDLDDADAAVGDGKSILMAGPAAGTL